MIKKFIRKVLGLKAAGPRRVARAKHSIERTHGRSSREHRQTLDTLAAAVQSRKMLTQRPAG